jgi:glycosyltransferase involved in cell wall biosynthesis
VLFVQSQEFFGADSAIHASIMRHLDRGRFEVHCAIPMSTSGEPCPAASRISAIPDVVVRPTDFGPSAEDRSRRLLVRELIRRGPRAAWSLVALGLHVRRQRIAIVHMTEKPRDAVYGTLVAMIGGARRVIHVHVKAETWIRRSVRLAMRRAHALIGVSAFVADTIVDLGYDRARVHAVLNGLELDEWSDEVDGTPVRAEFGIPRDAPLIVSASRLFRWKGQHELLQALPQVKREFPGVRVLIVGENDPRASVADDYRGELASLVEQLDLHHNVVFTGFRRDVRAIMAASDVYCMPSFEEPFGMVFTEAMALCRPVVALDNGGTREVVAHGSSGLLSPPGDIEALAGNLTRLLGDRALRQEMGANGRRRVVDHLNAKRMTRDVEVVYDRVLA